MCAGQLHARDSVVRAAAYGAKRAAAVNRTPPGRSRRRLVTGMATGGVGPSTLTRNRDITLLQLQALVLDRLYLNPLWRRHAAPCWLALTGGELPRP